jgi:hypothetical protein
VSQGIVHKHGGQIRVRSSRHPRHHGTCFVIFLPLAAQQTPAATSELMFYAPDLAGARQAAASGDDLSAA